jgi:hypothetical protein
VLTLRGGAGVTIDSTFAASATLPPRITIVGSDATLENVADRRLTVRDANGARDDLAMTAGDVDDHHVGPMRTFAASVRDAVRVGAVPDTVATFGDGLACDEILDRLRAAPLTRSD